MLASIEALSDDDVQGGPVEASASKARPRKRRLDDHTVMSDVRTSLRRVVMSSCRCCKKRRDKRRVNCFQHFRGGAPFDAVAKMRQTLWTMHKADADQMAA